MFKKPTVLILGAGASRHYGYPTGEELVGEVQGKCDALKSYFDEAVEQQAALMPKYVIQKFEKEKESGDKSLYYQQVGAWQSAAADCEQLKQRLRNVNPLVIDYFLGQNIELQTLGKLLIAWVIRERETRFERRLAESGHTQNDNWIRFILHRLIVGCSKSDELLSNQITFVTFNYDMSLEDQMWRGLDAFVGDRQVYRPPTSLDYYEKSVRSCYEALSLDFDEIEDL